MKKIERVKTPENIKQTHNQEFYAFSVFFDCLKKEISRHFYDTNFLIVCFAFLSKQKLRCKNDLSADNLV